MGERRAASRATALLFTAYVLVLLLVTLPPLWATLLVLPVGRGPQRLLRWSARLVLRLSGCRLRVSFAERLPTDGSVLLVANHASYVDSVVLMAVLAGPCRFVANHGLKTVPLIGTAIRKAGHLTVDRTAMRARRACLLAMMDSLRLGTSILVFPGGTISRGPALLPFRAGAFRAAMESGRPVVPISLSGTRSILPYRASLLRPGVIDVTIHEPIAWSAKGRQEIVRVRDCARRAIASGVDHGPGQE